MVVMLVGFTLLEPEVSLEDRLRLVVDTSAYNLHISRVDSKAPYL